MPVLKSICVLNYTHWFACVEPTLHPWKEANLVMVYAFLNEVLNSVCKNLIENVCIYAHQGECSIHFVLLGPYQVVVSGDCWFPRASLVVFLLLFYGAVWGAWRLALERSAESVCWHFPLCAFPFNICSLSFPTCLPFLFSISLMKFAFMGLYPCFWFSQLFCWLLPLCCPLSSLGPEFNTHASL